MPSSRIREVLNRYVLFTESDRSLYLTMIAAQLRGGRSYNAIFKDLLLDRNPHIRKLSELSLRPTSDFFASLYQPYFGSKHARLLQLAQKYSVVPEFIDNVLTKRPIDLSVFNAVIVKYITEWIIFVALLILPIVLYLNHAQLQESIGDFSSTLLYQIGSFLVEYRFLILSVMAGAACAYLYFLHEPGANRSMLASVGLYFFQDTAYAIELLSTIRILTSNRDTHAVHQQQLLSELSRIYGTNSFRRTQFRSLQVAIARGATLRNAMSETQILPAQELSLFRGLCPRNTVAEIHAASEVVANQLTAKLRLRIRVFATTIGTVLYTYLGFAMLSVIEITMGGGNLALNATTPT